MSGKMMAIVFGVCLMSALQPADRAWAAESLNVRTVGVWDLGDCRAAASFWSGGKPYALVGSGGRLAVLDVSEPVRPLLCGNLSLSGEILDISVSGQVAFLAKGDRVAAVSLSNLSRPRLLALQSLPDSVKRVSSGNGRLYLAAGSYGVIVANALDTAGLSIIGVCRTPGKALDVAADGQFVYTIDESAGLLKINAAVPSAPFIVARCLIPDSAVALEISRGTAFVASRYGPSTGIISLVALDSMSPVDTIVVPRRLEDVAICGEFLLAAAQDGTVHAYDVRDRRDQGPAGVCRIKGVSPRLAATESLAIVSDPTGVTILARSCLSHLPEMGAAGQGNEFVDLAIAGNWAYVADRSFGLRIFDISNPASPANLANISTPGEPEQVVVADNRLYLADGSSGILIYDLANPVNPLLLGFYDTPGTANGLSVLGTIAYVADGDSGLTILDVFNPSSPSLRFRHPITGFYARKCAVSKTSWRTNVALTGSGATYVFVEIRYAPIEKERRLGDPGHRIALIGNSVWVSTDKAVEVYPFPSPWGPTTLIHRFDMLKSNGRAFFLKGDFLYTANGWHGLQVQDITNKNAPIGAGHCPSPGFAQAISVSGSTAWLADGQGGLRSVDISALSRLDTAGYYQAPRAVYGLAGHGDKLYISDIGTGLRVLDCSNPALPREQGYCPLPGTSFGLAASGDRVFVASGKSGLRAVDVSDPQRPFVSWAYDTAGFFYSVCVRETLVYAAADSSGLLIFNVADPAGPMLVGAYNTPGNALGVALFGNIALVADGDFGLQLVDVSDPSQPTLRSVVPATDCANGVAVMGGHALVADGRAGLLVADVNDPENPWPVSQFYTGGYAREVSIRDSMCYLACADGGLSVVNLGRRPPPDYSRWLKTAPNPFGRQIRIELFLERETPVRASVFNIAGQLVGTLYEGRLPAGAHTFRWPADQVRLAGGLYMLRVQAGERVKTVRLVMIK